HVAVRGEFLVLAEVSNRAGRRGSRLTCPAGLAVVRFLGRARSGSLLLRLVLGDGHGAPRAGRRRSTALISIAYIVSSRKRMTSPREGSAAMHKHLSWKAICRGRVPAEDLQVAVHG